MGDNAWVTLATNDSYGLGALVLGHSLRQVGTRYQLAVLITPGVTEPMREQLRSIFSVVTEVNVLDSRDEANLALLSRPELGVTFTKLHCWRLIQFSKCVFLDADTLILQNCDELFEREELSAAPDAGWPDCFNSGVFVYKPSLDTFRSLIEFAVAKGSFDGGDQGLLNLFFKDWATQDISRHLPFIYNMCSTATYSYLPAYKQFGSQVKIIHFIGPNKPWLLYFDTVTRQVRPPAGSEHLQPLLQLWWDIFCNRVHPSLTNDMGQGTARPVSRFVADLVYRLEPPPITSNFEHNLDTSYEFWDPWESYIPPQIPQVQQNFQTHSSPHIPQTHQNFQTHTSNASQTDSSYHHTQSHNSHPSNNYESHIPSYEHKPHSLPEISYSQSAQYNTQNYQHNYSVNTLHVVPDVSHVSSFHHHSHEQHTHSLEPFIQSNNNQYTESSHQEKIHQQEPEINHSYGYVNENVKHVPEHRDGAFQHSVPPQHSVSPDVSHHDTSRHQASSVYPNSTSDVTHVDSVNNPHEVCSECVKITTEHKSFADEPRTQHETFLSQHDTGLAGAFAKLTLGVPRTAEQAALEEHMRKQAWEQGNIDYLGADSFDNIWKKICQTIASGPNENKVRQKSPSPVSTTETQESAKLLEPSPESSQPLESELAAESEDTLLKAQKVVSTSAPFGVGSISSTLEHTDTALADSQKLSQSSKVESSVPSDLKTVLPESNITHTSFVLVPQSTLEDSTKFTSSQEVPSTTFSSESKYHEDSSLEFRSSSLAEQSKSSTRQETNLGDTASVPVSENICQSIVSGHEKQIQPPIQEPSMPFSPTQEVPILSDPLQVGVQSVSVGATVPATPAEILAASETTKHTIPILPASVPAIPVASAAIQSTPAPSASAPTTPSQSVLDKETLTPPATVKTSALPSPVPAASVQTHLPSTPVQATSAQPTSLQTSETSTDIVTPAPTNSVLVAPATTISILTAPIPSPPVQGSPDATVPIQEAHVPLTLVQAVVSPSTPAQSTPDQTVPVPSAKASPAPIAPLHKASKKQSSDIQKAPSSTVSDVSSETTKAVTQKEVKSIPSLPEQQKEKSSDTAQGASAPVSPSTQDSTKHPLSEQAPIPPKRKGGSKGTGGDSKASSKQGKPASKGKK